MIFQSQLLFACLANLFVCLEMKVTREGKHSVIRRRSKQLHWFFWFFILERLLKNYSWYFRVRHFLFLARLVDISACLEMKIPREAKHLINQRRSIWLNWFFQFNIFKHFPIKYCWCFRVRKFLLFARLTNLNLFVRLEMKVTREAKHLIVHRRSRNLNWFFWFFILNHLLINYCWYFRASWKFRILFLARLVDISA